MSNNARVCAIFFSFIHWEIIEIGNCATSDAIEVMLINEEETRVRRRKKIFKSLRWSLVFFSKNFGSGCSKFMTCTGNVAEQKKKEKNVKFSCDSLGVCVFI